MRIAYQTCIRNPSGAYFSNTEIFWYPLTLSFLFVEWDLRTCGIFIFFFYGHFSDAPSSVTVPSHAPQRLHNQFCRLANCKLQTVGGSTTAATSTKSSSTPPPQYDVLDHTSFASCNCIRILCAAICKDQCFPWPPNEQC